MSFIEPIIEPPKSIFETHKELPAKKGSFAGKKKSHHPEPFEPSKPTEPIELPVQPEQPKISKEEKPLIKKMPVNKIIPDTDQKIPDGKSLPSMILPSSSKATPALFSQASPRDFSTEISSDSPVTRSASPTNYSQAFPKDFSKEISSSSSLNQSISPQNYPQAAGEISGKLSEISSQLNKNISEILDRGEKLEVMNEFEENNYVKFLIYDVIVMSSIG